MSDPIEQLYELMPPEQQTALNEINFLAATLREDLLLEQFYLGIEAMTARIQQLHPAIPCPSGCSRCCETYALPEVVPAEWELIESALAALPAEQQQTIAAAVAEQAAQVLDEQGTLRGKRREHAKARCPLLVEGRCSVYAHRPFDCRITGYSFSGAGERPLPVPLPRPQPLPYTCSNEQMRMLRELSRGLSPLEYMFLPQRERLLAVLRQIEPSDEGPSLLLTRLQAWAQAL